LEILNSLKDIVVNLKGSFDTNEVKLTFDILTHQIKQIHTKEIEKRCPVQYEETSDMLDKLKE